MGCDDLSVKFIGGEEISTHTSRVGCDVLFALLKFVWQISTHTSRVGCDARNAAIEFSVSKFLLTHPVWDVTNTH